MNHTDCTTFAVFGKRFGEILLKWLHASSFILARFNNRKTDMWRQLISDHSPPWSERAKPSSTCAGPLSNRAGRLIDPVFDSARTRVPNRF